MLEYILDRYNYWAIVGLMMIGLYITFQATNMIKRLVGLSIFQTTVFLFYITLSKVTGGSAPILYGEDYPKAAKELGKQAAKIAEAGGIPLRDMLRTDLENTYSNPLPHVLILTAIVVGVAVLALGLALIVRIREVYGSIEADEVARIDLETAIAETVDREEGEAKA